MPAAELAGYKRSDFFDREIKIKDNGHFFSPSILLQYVGYPFTYPSSPAGQECTYVKQVTVLYKENEKKGCEKTGQTGFPISIPWR